MFPSASSRHTHQSSTPEKMENNGYSKADIAATSNSVGDIEARMFCK
jgi:hypothetical protein